MAPTIVAAGSVKVVGLRHLQGGFASRLEELELGVIRVGWDRPGGPKSRVPILVLRKKFTNADLEHV